MCFGKDVYFDDDVWFDTQGLFRIDDHESQKLDGQENTRDIGGHQRKCFFEAHMLILHVLTLVFYFF